MPPIGPQGSRGGLMTAVVIFTIGFVVSTIFAIYYGVALNQMETTHTRDVKQQEQFYSSAASPRIVELGKESNEYLNLEDKTILGASIQDAQDLATLIAGPGASTTRPTNVIGDVRTQIQHVSDNLPGIQPFAADAPLADVITKLADYASSQQKLAEAAKAQAAQAMTDSVSAVANANAIAQKAQSDIATANEARGHAQDQVLASNTDYEQKVTNLSQQMDQEREQFNAEQKKAEVASAAKERTIDELQHEIDQLRLKLAPRRVNPENILLRQSDGEITSVADDGIVYINLGQADHVVEGMTFEIYDHDEGIPRQDNGMAEGNMPIGIGSIEIRHVSLAVSQCRVISTQPGKMIHLGDLVANIVYDRNTKYNFVVYGKFDLSQTGRASEVDADKIRSLILRWGGKLQTSPDVDTDFIVMGSEPVVTDLTPDEQNDPFLLREHENKVAERKRYNDILDMATKLHVAVMNQNRFLYFCGYFENAAK